MLSLLMPVIVILTIASSFIPTGYPVGSEADNLMQACMICFTFVSFSGVALYTYYQFLDNTSDADRKLSRTETGILWALTLAFSPACFGYARHLGAEGPATLFIAALGLSCLLSLLIICSVQGYYTHIIATVERM